MTLRLRRLIFYGLALLFLVITPTLLAYTAGYRWSFTQKRLVTTGALSVGTYPDNASIRIGMRDYAEHTPALISNLLPGTYDITVSKSGYYAWHKNLIVQNEKTTFAHEIVLFKQTLPTFINEATSLNALSKIPESFKAYKVIYDPKQERIIVIDNAHFRRVADVFGIAAIWRTNDNPLLFMYSPHEVWVFDPEHNTTTLFTRLVEEIKQVIAIPTRATAILILNNRVVATELDLHDTQNTWELAQFDEIKNASLAEDEKTLLIAGTRDGKIGTWQLELQ